MRNAPSAVTKKLLLTFRKLILTITTTVRNGSMMTTQIIGTNVNDGNKADITAHNFKWIVDRKATTTEKGSKHEECTVCGYKKTAVDIPAIDFGNSSDDQPNKPINTVSSESSSANQLNNTANTASPKTGNSGNIILWIALLFVSGGAFIAATAVDRKKTKNK